MKKKKAINIICECAKQYSRKLSGRNFLIIYSSKCSDISWIEVKFEKHNFMHLTGAYYKNANANQFFNMALKGRLEENSIKLRASGNTVVKLEVLPYIINIMQSGGLVSDNDNGQGIELKCNKLIGKNFSCMGLNKANRFYYPITILKEDIRKRGLKVHTIQLVISKSRKEKKYCKMEYKNRKQNCSIPPEILYLIDEDLVY